MHRRALLVAGGSLVAVAALEGCKPSGQTAQTGQGAAPASPGVIGDAQAQSLITAIQNAPSHGFKADAFGDPAGFKDDPGHARLRKAAEAYARAMHGLAIPKGQMDKNWGLKRADYDAAQDLSQALAQNRVDDWLKSLPPPQPEYQALLAAYGRYLKIGESGWPQLSVGARIAPGAAGPQVDALRQRLAVEDPSVSATAQGQPADAMLVQALQRYQTDQGLRPTGQLDADTLKALNVPARARAAQIRANLERWRWVPREQAPSRIEVNSAAQTFVLYLDGQPKIHLLAAAGRPGDESPILTSKINSVILNPPWRVPDDIAEKELYPKEAKDPGYFERNDFVQNPPGESVKLLQKAGPKSALGVVKFQFPNTYSVYLHDTPSKAAFNQTQRSVSHGCIRLQMALDFAKYLLSKEPNWSPERVDQVVASRDETPINLAHDVPIRLMYWTAFPIGGGRGRDDAHAGDEVASGDVHEPSRAQEPAPPNSRSLP